MAEAINVSAPVAGTDKTISFEAGKLAGQADGAVVVRMGDTQVLVTATAGRARDGADFFPLTVDIEERMYAAGRIPGSFFRREGRASEDAILTCRLIDRPLRPAFPDGFRNECHIVGTILGIDGANPYDVVALNGASAALTISGIPFEGPIGAVRLAYSTDGEWIPQPTYEESDAATFDMVVAGRLLDDGDVAVMMVEAGGTEKSFSYYADGAPKVDEAVLAAGLDAAKPHISDIVKLQRQLAVAHGVADPISWTAFVDYSDEIMAAVEEIGAEKMAAAMTIANKAERADAESETAAFIVETLGDRFADVADGEKQIRAAGRALAKKIVRKRIVDEGVRIDGRGPADLRSLSSEVGLLPTAHGSGLFQRGETQALNVTTLAMLRMEQIVDTLNPSDRKRYMHHYNMPPYSTGEAGFMRGPKRREIGHGALAEKALLPVIPSKDDFPYTLRLVSDVLSSNGSTSMASVCASSLSLMDAGVPIVAPVAGIAMGLVFAEGKYTPLTDILGAEDAFGDMDFKVAGTSDAVTALQLDTKIDGIPADVLAQALNQAKDARMAILDVMTSAIDGPREDVAESAPKIVSMEIPLEKIGEVIGPRGKVINTIQEETGADIAVDDDGMVGTVAIGGVDRGAVEEAKRQIELIVNPPTPEVGKEYTGPVVNITKFGAFVNLMPGTDGLLHISKLGGGKRIDKVEDVVSLGDLVTVRVDDIDPNGKLALTPVQLPGGPVADGGSTENGGGGGRSRGGDSDSGGGDAPARKTVSFDDAFDEEMAAEHGDLGPAKPSGGGGGGGRGGRRRRRRSND
ncbi:MAG: polyribonucleotide nucleotidyltransferase [Actinomycetota bacterium]